MPCVFWMYAVCLVCMFLSIGFRLLLSFCLACSVFCRRLSLSRSACCSCLCCVIQSYPVTPATFVCLYWSGSSIISSVCVLAVSPFPRKYCQDWIRRRTDHTHAVEKNSFNEQHKTMWLSTWTKNAPKEDELEPKLSRLCAGQSTGNTLTAGTETKDKSLTMGRGNLGREQNKLSRPMRTKTPANKQTQTPPRGWQNDPMSVSRWQCLKSAGDTECTMGVSHRRKNGVEDRQTLHRSAVVKKELSRKPKGDALGRPSLLGENQSRTERKHRAGRKPATKLWLLVTFIIFCIFMDAT